MVSDIAQCLYTGSPLDFHQGQCLAAVSDLPSKGVTIVTGVGRDTGARNHTAITNLLIRLQQEGALVRDFKDNQGWFTVRLLPPV